MTFIYPQFNWGFTHAFSADNYCLSHTEGCEKRLIFCLLAARAPLVRRRGGVCRQYGLAYAHYNEKPCPVTIDTTLHYEGVYMSYIAL